MAGRLWFRGLLALGLIAVCAAAGFGYASWSISRASQSSVFIHNGQWFTSRYVGSHDADLKTRAFVAATGLLGLSREETVYYRTNRDAEGRPISSQYEYEITGPALPARWWSLTLYDHDHFMNPAATGPLSVKSTQIETGADGRFRIILSARPHEGNWIDMGDGHDMSMSLRMYNPGEISDAALGELPLPVIRRLPPDDE
jgi:hypothetical protein